MASNNIDNEKPNLRPTKHNTATGKTLFLHHNPNKPSNKSFIRATWKKDDQQENKLSSDRQNPFGIQQPDVEYSLNKRQRWEIFNDLRRQTGYLSSSSSSSLNSDDDGYYHHTQSDSEQRQKKLKHRRQILNIHQKKYRLQEFHNIRHQTKYIQITSNTKQESSKTEKKKYLNEPIDRITKEEENPTSNNETTNETNSSITYFAVVPPRREKRLVNIKKNYTTKSKNIRSSTQRSKFTEVNDQFDFEDELDEQQHEDLSTDNEESSTEQYTSFKSGNLGLNDFIPIKPDANDNDRLSIESESSDGLDFPKQKKRFHRQLSKEEKLYYRDMATYIKMQEKSGETIKPKEKSLHHLMSLSYREIRLYQTDLTVEYLSKTYGKNFLHAQCYPTKYLICLTDRLQSFQWSNKFDFFSFYAALDCYLVIVLNDKLNNENNICPVHVGLNMDLYADTIEIASLSQSNEKIYRIEEVIERTIGFVTDLSFNKFKPIDSAISQKKYYRNKVDSDLSETEFINKQIEHIHRLDKKDLETKLNNKDSNIDENNLIRPNICITCCNDMNESTPMTALKSCGHWLCNQCWKQYLETSIKTVSIIRCPEWNCFTFLDVGTILSLANVRCMNIYERNIEKCLVNLSRSYVKCPLKSCSLIVEVINSGMDHVRCRCGHQFCIECKQEPHFPALCSSYREYIDEVRRNGDISSDYNVTARVHGRHCVSCNNFIEKNGGCNHMTCRCGAEFCWICTEYWKDHFKPNGQMQCPRKQVAIQKKIIVKERNPSRRLYEHALFHRYERTFLNQAKLNENVKRLIGSIPLEKEASFDASRIKSQIAKRETLLQHAYEMIKYVNYLHRVCEFIAVSADGYANNPIEFSNILYPFESIIFNMTQILEIGRGYQAIEHLNDLHKRSEQILERLRRAVSLRKLNQTGYITS